MAISKEWKETVAPDERERFERYATILADLQRARGGKDRALHAKQHAGLRAKFEVLGDLPEHARVAMFAEPKTFDAYVRFSNGSGARVSDDKPDVRGLAIKVLGVPGKKLIPGLEDATTQDFLFINSDALAFSSVDDFVWFAQAAAGSPALLPLKLFAHFGLGTFAFLKKAMASTKKIASLATQTYFSAPTRFGDYAVRFSLAPKQTDEGAGGASLADEIAARLAKGDLAWDVRAQFFVGEDKTPIEDSSIAWDAPFVTLARLTIPQQDVAGDDGKEIAKLVESLSFDPWHALVELRPIGAVMRARNPAYRESTKQREAAKEPSA